LAGAARGDLGCEFADMSPHDLPAMPQEFEGHDGQF